MLGNICVDTIVPVPALPGQDLASKRAALAALTADPPPREVWEVGGSANAAIAASRLGLRAACTGPLGHDAFGDFMAAVLEEEGVGLCRTAAPPTLVCNVLVDPVGRHAFVSGYDTGPWPMLGEAGGAFDPGALAGARCLLVSGVVFDEAPGTAVLAALHTARSAGATVLFDPGPRAWTFASGPRRAILAAVLALADCVLMTEAEAQELWGRADIDAAEAAAGVVSGSLGDLLRRAEHGNGDDMLDGADNHHYAIVANTTKARRAGSNSDSGNNSLTTPAPTVCIIKRGPDGAVLALAPGCSGACFGGGERCDDGSSKGAAALYGAPAHTVTVQDTVGCGDAFAAATVLGCVRQLGPEATLALANAAGAATAQSRGAGRGVARAAAVRQLLAAAAQDEGRGQAGRAAAARALAALPPE